MLLKNLWGKSEESIRLSTTGIVTAISIDDVSKRAGIQKFKTTIAIDVLEITPPEIAQQCQFSHLHFIDKTQKGDHQIVVGDRITLELRAYDLAKPDYFTLIKTTKIA